ncbi:MAG: hypothetical protein COW00_06770 [Bdellovibrio sp. CG12_big_fil_rev_8_21_14_0_65_39_13]|nr:MAG: hypothetical protein COW78_10620 [Bdellovibrio sp. CG22_combo_CG10-13_8_21_14_all_39_27]PIQ60455.1 MAG: hypothetical protein COW00_06770 [Bdellovibrio sp. CG12_big_fil_rev_8_21_14_0_65_39_13]PIR36105.1 MAG: hypothetical protein COV37_05005 [Bdellovibrio sp. CG11_big_fil_rev_8_21_14_0_20_39_38]
MSCHLDRLEQFKEELEHAIKRGKKPTKERVEHIEDFLNKVRSGGFTKDDDVDKLDKEVADLLTRAEELF